MAENSISIWQSQIDHYDEDIKRLEGKKADVVKEAESHGLFFRKGKFVSETTVIGAVSRWAYYSKYVGERGAMYDFLERAYQSSHDMPKIVLQWTTIDHDIDAGKVVPLISYFEFFAHFKREMGDYIGFPSADDWSGKNYPYRNMKEDEREEELREKCEEYFSMFKYDNQAEQMLFRFIGSSDQEEYVNHSGFTVGKFSSLYISGFKPKNFDDKFDAFDDELEWK